MAARRVLREVEGAVLISGTNLPMLLDFVLSLNPDAVDAAIAAVERGRSSIVAVGGPP